LIISKKWNELISDNGSGTKDGNDTASGNANAETNNL
jgi:hypothetical protein